ncbi:putative 3-methyladenine DNA glycosylase 1 domain protein [Synechococcus sp. BIOS-U3-1]|nr:putative 3-methyladenine DNA glycosylase 1 domain protein [Synechococcus sp. BIOS-U3-1]
MRQAGSTWPTDSALLAMFTHLNLLCEPAGSALKQSLKPLSSSLNSSPQISRLFLSLSSAAPQKLLDLS